MESFRVLNISDETKLLFKECFDKNGSSKNIEEIEWQFLKNPIPERFVNIAVDEEESKTAAIYAISPVNFKLEDKVFVGSQSLDTMTDKDYRGRGLFIKLANDVYRKAEEGNVKLVYGFPNGNSIHGFQKRLAWEVLDPVPFLIKPLRSKYFTNRISFLRFLPNIPLSFSRFKKSNEFNLEFKNEFPIEVDTVWNSFSKNISVSVNRNKAYLDWRYLSKPNEDYKIIHCYTHSGDYLGYVVYAVKVKHGGKIGYLMELVYDLNNEKAGALLLRKAIAEMKKQNADCILSWCLEHSPNYNLFKSEAFFTMPEKLRPIELHFGARAFDKSLEKIIAKRSNWYLSYSDSDTV